MTLLIPLAELLNYRSAMLYMRQGLGNLVCLFRVVSQKFIYDDMNLRFVYAF